ncbi:MAG: anti-sigma factor family protein [Candidatus Binataceae bacterium]
MALCNEMIPLLGPFEDAELSPAEMQQVARHLAECARCEATVSDYRALGSWLREEAVEPALAGFADAVTARIEQLGVPFNTRLACYFHRFGERIGAAAAMGVAAAAAAAVTVVLMTPVARGVAARKAVSPAIGQPAALIARNNLPYVNQRVAATPVSDSLPSLDNLPVNLGPDSSKAIISRLEADSPSVAVWSEPRTDTTVIWVPDRQP